MPPLQIPMTKSNEYLRNTMPMSLSRAALWKVGNTRLAARVIGQLQVAYTLFVKILKAKITKLINLYIYI